MKHKYWLEAVLLCGVMQSAPAQSMGQRIFPVGKLSFKRIA